MYQNVSMAIVLAAVDPIGALRMLPKFPSAGGCSIPIVCFQHINCWRPVGTYDPKMRQENKEYVCRKNQTHNYYQQAAGLSQCFSTGVLRNLRVPPLRFRQWYPRVPRDRQCSVKK